MVSMDVFRQDAFSAFQLTSTIERIPYQPSLLGDMRIFRPEPIRTVALGVEERDGQLIIIKTSQRGAPVNSERTTERRKMRYFATSRLTQGDTLQADEIQGIRDFGQETALMQVQAEVARRLAGPTGLKANIGYTKERMRLAALQGKLIDADDTVLYDWFDEFQIDEPDTFYFNLAAQAASTIRGICNDIIRAMYRAAKGAMPPGTRIGALCGDAFYDAFVQHVDVIRTFTSWSEAAALRNGMGGAFTNFIFGDIEWINYRGSDDNAEIKVADNEVKFFPINAPDVFVEALSPLESMDFVNTPGMDSYVIPIFDRDRNFWWRQEVYSYPLFICKRPEILQKGSMIADPG